MSEQKFNDISDMYYLEFEEPTDAVVRNGNSMEGDGSIHFHNLTSVKIENPGEFWTSPDGNWLFKKNATGTWVVRYFGEDTEVVVPDGITGIARHAFEENFNIKSVHLPDSIREIGYEAFNNCQNLREINFPEGLVSMGGDVFQWSKLKEIELPSSLKYMHTSFRECKELETVIFHENSKMTAMSLSFSGCTKLSRFVFPDHLETIDSYCFYDCVNLKEIHLPATVKCLDRGTFYCAEDVYLESLPEGVISAVVYSPKLTEVNLSETFTVHYHGHRIVLPRRMDYEMTGEVEKTVKDTNQDIALYELSNNPIVPTLAALETYRKYRFDSAKKYLAKCGYYPFMVAGWVKREDLVAELLDMFRGEKVLTHEMLVVAKKVCDEHNWNVTRARVMNMLHNTKSEISFTL